MNEKNYSFVGSANFLVITNSDMNETVTVRSSEIEIPNKIKLKNISSAKRFVINWGEHRKQDI